MSSNGPLIEADDFRKKVSGTVFGFIPESRTWDSKLVICAITRHGAVTGEHSANPSTATEPSAAAASSIAARSASSSLVLVAAVEILAAPVGVWTHQASLVRRTEMVTRQQLSVGR